MTDTDTRDENTDGDRIDAAAPAPAEPAEAVERRHRWFTVAWPVAVIFHLLANISSIPLAASLQLVAGVLAALVVLRPRLSYVLTLATIFPVITYLKAPFIGNHELILAMTALVVLGSGLVSGRRWPAAALPVLRWLLIIAYGSIAISKLNRSFLDPSVSCAVQFADEFSTWFDFRVSELRSLSLAAIWTTVIVELGIPMLLLVRRLRVIGVLVAMVFHFVLALEPAGHVYDFTATLFPLFLAFAPSSIRESVTDRIEGLAGGSGRSAIAFGSLVVIVAHLTVLVATSAPVWVVAYPVWLAVGTSVLWWVFSSAVDRRRELGTWSGDRVRARAPLAILVPAVAILTVNAAAPYLELRTAAGFNMYSNLETVGVDGDHLLSPMIDGVRSHDLVLITEAPEEHPLAYYATEGRALPAANLRWFQRDRQETATAAELASDDEVTLRWLSGSEAADGPRRLSDLDLGDGGWSERLAHKFGFVRAVDLSRPAGCLRTWGPAG